MTTIYLALGSNVGDSLSYIDKSIELLSEHIINIKLAPIYASSAVGYVNQPDFYNTAISGQTQLTPTELLDFVKQTENNIGRIERFKWGPREIDIDIILYGNLSLDTQELVIPHPAYVERDFVMKPLLDIEPSLIDPISFKPIKQILDQIELKNRSILKVVDPSS